MKKRKRGRKVSCESLSSSSAAVNSGRPRSERRNKFVQSVGARRLGSASPIDPTLPRNSDDSAGRFVPRPWLDFRRLRSGERTTWWRARETRPPTVRTSNFLSLVRFPLSWLFRVVKYGLIRIINSTVCGAQKKTPHVSVQFHSTILLSV